MDGLLFLCCHIIHNAFTAHHTDRIVYFTSLLAWQKAVGVYGVSSILHSILGAGEDIIAVA